MESLRNFLTGPRLIFIVLVCALPFVFLGTGSLTGAFGGSFGSINGEDVTLKASMAKLKAGRLSREVTDACLQYWGGMGYMWDNPVSRAYRDSRLTSIGGGADEVMLGIISKYMGILPSRKKR